MKSILIFYLLRFIYNVTLFPLQINILFKISHEKSDLCFLNVKTYHFNCITALINILPSTLFSIYNCHYVYCCTLQFKDFYFHITVGYLKEGDTRVLNCHGIKAVCILKNMLHFVYIKYSLFKTLG